MLGEFELPGSEEKGEKAGGSSDKQQGGGGAKQDEKSGQQGGGGQQSAAGSSAQSSSESASSGNSIAQNDPSAKAEGVESANLSGPDGGGTAAAQGDAAPAKPGEIKVGDAKMQIKTLPSGTAANVVGAQQPVGKDSPQQYEARMPGGGKQSGPGNGNKGVEKGRTMPTGL
ncbi:MAG: hypothetical protein EXS39_07065 [Opitutaceae bacterium]|nr:hypothetical protein [Opitutaceae bacterium]